MKIAKVAAFIEILNGIVHIVAAIYVGRCYPGCLSAVGLLIIGSLLYAQIEKAIPNIKKSY